MFVNGKKRLVIWGFCAALAGGIIPQGMAASPQAKQIKLDARTARNLKAQIQNTGTTRIIVELTGEPELDQRAATPPGLERSPDGLASYRNAIIRVQEKVLSASGTQRGVKKFHNVAALSMEVTAAELDSLRLMSEVSSIREDILLEPTLDVSAPQIGVDNVWSLGYTGIGQAVAILDTGVDTSHPSLADKVVAEACFSTTSSGSTSLCPDGSEQQFGQGAGANCGAGNSCRHGTHVAGIAGGSDSRFTGVAPGADLIAIQVFSLMDNGSVLAYYSDVLMALDWLYDQRNQYSVASANMSLGGGRYTGSCNNVYPAFTDIVETCSLQERPLSPLRVTTATPTPLDSRPVSMTS